MPPLCFVLMPFGHKPASSGTQVDFDAVYRELIQPAIEAAGMQPLRADEEMAGGIIHKPMFERLILCEYAIADLTTARRQGVEAVRAFAAGLGDIANVESAVVIDLFLSYRAVKAWQDMIELVDRMAPPLAETVMVQEQLALALNRAGRGEEAERVLLDLIARRGPSSETYGILGRVYKDRWEHAAQAGDTLRAAGLLDKAIEAYRKGFEADWRDAYPGVNAVTLMEIEQALEQRA